MGPHIRLITLADVPVLTDLLEANREFMAPFEPDRDDSYFTVDGQRAVVTAALQAHEAGRLAPYVVLDGSGNLIGRITLNDIVRGPLQSAVLGYWVDAAHNGRGLASAAVAEMITYAFDELRLHRLEAGTLLDNVRSQRVLERNRFERYGVAPKLLKINGDWQDHVLFQLLSAHEM